MQPAPSALLYLNFNKIFRVCKGKIVAAVFWRRSWIAFVQRGNVRREETKHCGELWRGPAAAAGRPFVFYQKNEEVESDIILQDRVHVIKNASSVVKNVVQLQKKWTRVQK